MLYQFVVSLELFEQMFDICHSSHSWLVGIAWLFRADESYYGNITPYAEKNWEIIVVIRFYE